MKKKPATTLPKDFIQNLANDFLEYIAEHIGKYSMLEVVDLLTILHCAMTMTCRPMSVEKIFNIEFCKALRVGLSARNGGWRTMYPIDSLVDRASAIDPKWEETVRKMDADLRKNMESDDYYRILADSLLLNNQVERD